MTQEEIEKRIEEVVENFDFDKVHRFMVQKNWKLINFEGNLEIPSKDRLIKEATGLLKYVAHKCNDNNIKKYSVCAVGFDASFCEGTIYLKFLPFKYPDIYGTFH